MGNTTGAGPSAPGGYRSNGEESEGVADSSMTGVPVLGGRMSKGEGSGVSVGA